MQAAAPSRPIKRGVTAPGLLAHAKYADHLPLYRQSEIYAPPRRDGTLDAGALGGWHESVVRTADRVTGSACMLGLLK